MAVKYVCCQCGADMTNAAKQDCEAAPVSAPTLTIMGMHVIHRTQLVTATRSN
jgi:hypothetical protein